MDARSLSVTRTMLIANNSNDEEDDDDADNGSPKPETLDPRDRAWTRAEICSTPLPWCPLSRSVLGNLYCTMLVKGRVVRPVEHADQQQRLGIMVQVKAKYPRLSMFVAKTSFCLC